MYSVSGWPGSIPAIQRILEWDPESPERVIFSVEPVENSTKDPETIQLPPLPSLLRIQLLETMDPAGRISTGLYIKIPDGREKITCCY